MRTQDNGNLLERYEALRAGIIEHRRDRLFGLAVMLREGMVAWMMAMATLRPASSEMPVKAPGAMPVRCGIELGEFVTVLALMLQPTLKEDQS